MNILALDFGTKRIGVAVGDDNLGVAFPRNSLKNDETDAQAPLLKICREENIKKIIVGLPVLPQGRETVETENARIFAEGLEDFLLSKSFNIPVDFIDERFSSRSAKNSAKNMGKSEKQMRGNIDSSAAAIFLQMYLDS